jgi:hypothetical protein
LRRWPTRVRGFRGYALLNLIGVMLCYAQGLYILRTMLGVFAVVWMLGVVGARYNSLFTDYEEYLEAWRELGGKVETVEAGELGSAEESCKGRPCTHRYYLQTDQALIDQPERNKTVLVVGALRGNDYATPTIIHSLFPLPAGRVIYFPMPNPSGFCHNTQAAYPTNLDPRQDFPFPANIHCNLTSAMRILDHLFRKYTIDLAIHLYEGGPAFGYSWSTLKDNVTEEDSLF